MSSKIKLFTVPNALTLCNLLCGCGAIVSVFSQSGAGFFWWIAAAALFDLLDGAVARLLGQHSEIGKQLDSLADMVSFGAAPAAMLFVMYGREPSPRLPEFLGWTMFAVALFSALRLAKFNVDDSQSEDFAGLPTPAAALAVASLSTWWQAWLLPRETYLGFAALVCVLLVCRMRMFSLKFKNFMWSGNELRFIFLIASAIIVATLRVQGVAAAIGLYVLLSATSYRRPVSEK